MSQPITIDGHSKKVTISLRASHKVTSSADGVTTIELDADPAAPFAGFVVKNGERVMFETADYTTRWSVTIK